MNKSFMDFCTFASSMFFPNRCIFCNEPIDPFESYCAECEDSVEFIKGDICLHCGAAKEDCVCNKKKTVYYDGIVSAMYYENKVKDCIHRFKFKDERRIAKPIARLMAKAFKKGLPILTLTMLPMYRCTAEKSAGAALIKAVCSLLRFQKSAAFLLPMRCFSSCMTQTVSTTAQDLKEQVI